MLDAVLARTGRCHVSHRPGAGCSGGLPRAASQWSGLQPAATAQQSAREKLQTPDLYNFRFFPQNLRVEIFYTQFQLSNDIVVSL